MRPLGSSSAANLAARKPAGIDPGPLAVALGAGGREDPVSSARFILKERTAAQHEMTEAAFAAYDISRPSHYRTFLSAHAMALPDLEIAVTGRGWSGWKPRLPHLADDLAALGAWLPSPMVGTERSDAGVWGTQYVLEGSKLGGRMLASQLPEGTPASYLSPDPDMAACWQAFCAAFDQAGREGGTEWLDEVTDAAIETFQTFRRAASALVEELN